MVDRVGQRFGDYRLRRLVSDRGAFADVYEGEHVVDRTKAAVKIWKVQIEAKTFLNDVRAAVLRHPHIVEILDFNIKGDVPYLVMAYAPHGSLQAQPLPLSLNSIVIYVRQIADALSYAHQRGIVHRDIKPDNILLGPKQEVWVGDFGIATSSYTRQDTFLEGLGKHPSAGTPAYMAPEQWSGNASPASDQYALGILVYECLCGKRPFHGDVFALGHQHTNVPPPPLHEQLPTISPTVEQVVMRTLEKDWKKRYPHIQDFAQALDQVYQAEQQTVASFITRESTVGTLLYSYQVPRESIYSFSWMQNRPRLAIGGTNGKIEAWDFTTGSLFSRQIEGQNAHISWSPNGQRLACLSWYQNEMIAKLQLWDAEAGNCFATYAKAWEPLIWSPDSTCIAFHSYKSSKYNPQDGYGFDQEHFDYKYWLDIDIHNDQTFQIWNIDKAQLISTLSIFKGSTGELIPLNHAIVDLQDILRGFLPRPVWSPDSKHIAFSPRVDPSERWVIPVYEVATGNFITAYPLQRNLAAPPGAYNKAMWRLGEGNIIWSPDATHIACCAKYFYKGISWSGDDNDLREKKVWHHQESQFWAIATQSEITIAPRSRISTLVWSPDSACVAFPSTKEVEIWDVATKRKQIEAYEGHTAPIVALAWSPDNKRIASADSHGKIHIWDAYSVTCILILETHLSVLHPYKAIIEWSPDGTHLAFIKDGRDQGSWIQVWQVV